MNSNSRNSSKKGKLTFPSKPCPKNVSDDSDAISFDLSLTWFHIKYKHFNHIDYKCLKGCNEPWYYLCFINTLFPFGNLTNQNFLTLVGNNIINETKNLNSSK